MEKIGWIGIGKMGKPMSKRLLDAGYQVFVCDINRTNTIDIVREGAIYVETPAELMRHVNIAFSIIPNSKVLKTIVFDDNGLLQTIRQGSIFIDMSTVDPESSAMINEAIEKAGSFFIRSNVSGSTENASKGTLAGLSSGNKEIYERILPILRHLTSRQYYLGAYEEARYMKIIVNMMLATCVQAMAESLVMGQAVGLDWNTLIDVLADSAAGCPAVRFKVDQYKRRDFSPMSTAAIMDKDLDIAMNIAKEYKLAMPLASMSRQLYSSMGSTGKADLDYSAILLVNEELNGIKHDECK